MSPDDGANHGSLFHADLVVSAYMPNDVPGTNRADPALCQQQGEVRSDRAAAEHGDGAPLHCCRV